MSATTPVTSATATATAAPAASAAPLSADDARVQAVARPAIEQTASKPEKPQSCLERFWSCLVSIPILGHLLSAIAWVVQQVVSWIFGVKKPVFTEKAMAELLVETETRIAVLSKSVRSWKLDEMDDLIQLTALCNDIVELQDSMVAFQEQFSPESKEEGGLKGDFDTVRAQRLQEESHDLFTALKAKVELKSEDIAKLLQKAFEETESKYEEWKKMDGSDAHEKRSAGFLLLFACGNYLRAFSCLSQFELAGNDDANFQNILKINEALRKEMGYSGALPIVWARQAAHGFDLAGDVVPGEIGLPNIGNSCYINSGLQLVLGMDEFADLINQKLKRRPKEAKDAFKKRKAVQKALRKVVLTMKERDGKAIGKALTNFRAAFFRSGLSPDFVEDKRYGLSQQHDGASFVTMILDALQFSIGYRQVRTYEHIGADIVKEGPISPAPVLPLAFPTDDGRTLQQVFDHEFNTQKVDDPDSPVNVSIDGQTVKFSKYTCQGQIAGEIPDSMFVSFLRRNPNGSKNCSAIMCPKGGLVDMTAAFDPVLIKGSVKYKVASFQVHHGRGFGGGHYTAYSHCPDGKWYHYNDNYVKEVSAQEAEEEMGHAYCLLLKRV